MSLSRKLHALITPATLLSAAVAHGQVGDIAHVHDPAIIRQGDIFYIFGTGRGISVRTSRDLIHWTRGKPVFNTTHAWAKNIDPHATFEWAPDISFTHGEYRLYYAISTFGTNHSGIGLATNATLNPADAQFKWVDRGQVVATDSHDDWNAIDPAAFTDADRQPWLAAGSYWSGIKLFKLDKATGLVLNGDQPRAIAARHGDTAIEAPFLTRHDDWYYLWVSFDHCCKGAQSTYNIRVGRSRSVEGPYVDANGKSMLDGGGTVVLASNGNVRGPGHCAVLHDGDTDYLVHHWYDAAQNGLPKLGIRRVQWDAAGWPHAGDPLTPPDAPSTGPAGK